MKKIILIIVFSILSLGLFAQAGTLYGTITDTLGEPLAFASIAYEKEGLDSGTYTDLDGKYSILVEPGIYKVTFSTLGYETVVVEGVIVIADKKVLVDRSLREGGISFVPCKMMRYWPVLFQKDVKDGHTFSAQ